MTICSAVMSARSALPFVIAGPDGATAAITASLVSALIVHLEEIGPPDDLLAPTMVLITFSTAVTGVVLWMIAALRASNAVRYIPFPVIGGFLAATGWLMINGGMRIVTEHKLDAALFNELYGTTSLKILAAAAMGLGIVLVQRLWKSPYAIPVAILSGVLIGHLAIMFSDASLIEAQANGWFVHPPRLEGRANTWDFGDLKLFPWASIPGLGGDIVGMIFVTTITMLLNTNGIEFIIRRDVNLEHELKIIGAANILSAICGGYVGCTSLSRTTLNYEVGGRGRLSGLIVALISGVVLFKGAGFAGYAPKFVLGGLMFTLGFGMLKKWLVDSLYLISRSDYLILLIVTGAILIWGFIAGIFVGILIGCVSFAYGASKTESIKFSFDGAEYRSSLDRRPEENAILANNSREIQGFVLQGYLFFGSANKLYEKIRSRVFAQSGCRFLIFDFTHVNGVDSSAIQSFRQIKQIAETRNMHLVIVNLTARLRKKFSTIITETDINVDNLDLALEKCENEIISTYHSDYETTGLHDWLAKALGSPNLAAQLVDCCERQMVQTGEVIAAQGAPADSMHFILAGRLGIMVQLDTGMRTRVRSLGPYTTVGEMGLLTGGVRSATIQAEADSLIYRLEKHTFETMKQSNPELSQALLSHVVTVMAERLRATSNMVALLHR